MATRRRIKSRLILNSPPLSTAATTTAAVMSYSLLTQLEPCRPAGKLPSASPVFKSTAFTEVDLDIEGVSTLFELFERSVKEFSESPCVGSRKKEGDDAGEYKFHSYQETWTMVRALSSMLTREQGLVPGKKVGIIGANSPEWMVAMQVGRKPHGASLCIRSIVPQWRSSAASGMKR